MILKTIQYSESYEFSEYGLKRWRKFGLEGELGENEDVMNAHVQLKSMVDAMKTASIAALEEFKGTHTVVIEERPIDPVTTVVADINSCKEVKVLETYRFIVKGNPELEFAYEEKMKELSK